MVLHCNVEPEINELARKNGNRLYADVKEYKRKLDGDIQEPIKKKTRINVLE
jgi:hypothetical protein